MNPEVLKTIREKGLLLEKSIFDVIDSFQSSRSAQQFLEYLERFSGQKIITRSLLVHNHSFVEEFVRKLPGEEQQSVEKVILKLGLKVEISKEKEISNPEIPPSKETGDISMKGYSIFYANTRQDKKIGVEDFVGAFRSRYQSLQKILLQRTELYNLISINKIASDRKQISIIGMVTEKRTTKNKNIIITFEDLTGRISALVKEDMREVYAKARELQLDDIVAVKASGNKDLLFLYDIHYPDAFLPQKVTFQEETNIAFLSDIHCGSDRHLGKCFENFLNWLDGEDIVARKISYLFFVGDNVDGVGIFPGQEHVLELKSMQEQYSLLASYLRRVPKNITMFMCPGQHDAVRVAEPQPIISKKYAAPLYDIENLVLVTNPALIKLKEGKKEFKVLMYHGASIHQFINEIPELRESKAHRTPAKAVRHMLKRRHLAPTHSSAIYIPSAEQDPLVINEVPDVLCTGEVHRLDIENYNNVLIITGSCWQSQTPFEEKVGNIPDPAKVPVLNLKTRELKVLDFNISDESKGDTG